MTEPQRPKELPSQTISHKRNHSWEREVIEEEEIFGVPTGTIIEIKKLNPYPIYVAFICNLVEKEPTCFVEAMKQKEWVDSMVKEYQSIINNDVWEVVPRPKNK